MDSHIKLCSRTSPKLEDHTFCHSSVKTQKKHRVYNIIVNTDMQTILHVESQKCQN